MSRSLMTLASTRPVDVDSVYDIVLTSDQMNKKTNHEKGDATQKSSALKPAAALPLPGSPGRSGGNETKDPSKSTDDDDDAAVPHYDDVDYPSERSDGIIVYEVKISPCASTAEDQSYGDRESQGLEHAYFASSDSLQK